ncbi:uncharacterized protein CLUP02_01410 [Colletotrichum lupini]|uniref:Uncharacterized protein n=1 Tax=Colletotrichum lupini TaxID=145971 RepID=A0A9Q8SCV5_9PEZI|nr:uncharacterized protein CLUP02_01410 [Colletotrichum lupini]UQC74758.1 hypothetical protein CLUP02_01410 [Colletotrichum lupini]
MAAQKRGEEREEDGKKSSSLVYRKMHDLFGLERHCGSNDLDDKRPKVGLDESVTPQSVCPCPSSLSVTESNVKNLPRTKNEGCQRGAGLPMSTLHLGRCTTRAGIDGAFIFSSTGDRPLTRSPSRSGMSALQNPFSRAVSDMQKRMPADCPPISLVTTPPSPLFPNGARGMSKVNRTIALLHGG